jgi:outer membrane protein
MKSIRSILMIVALAAPASAQPPAEQTLTLPRAIEIAKQQQPSIRVNRANIESSLARVDQARVAQRPQVSLSATVAASSSQPPTGGFFDPQLRTGLGANANWRIFDFGQTRANIRAAEASAQAVAATVGTTTLDIESSVSIAFLEAIARQRLIAVFEATVKSEELHLDQARRFVAAQAKDPIEVVQAQARAANARSSLAQAQSSAAVALANLRSAIGWVDPQVTFVVDQSWPSVPTEDPAGLVALVETARKRRPEIAQLDLQIVAAEASVTAARAQRRPVLSAQANTGYDPGSGSWDAEPTWNAGLTLSWDLYDGGRSAADVRAARAGVAGAIAQRDQLLVSLNSQLDAARAQIISNRANVTASTEAVEAARAQLKLADARYAQGLGSQIELADAQTAVTTAEGNLITAEWQLADAWAQLRRALGTP